MSEEDIERHIGMLEDKISAWGKAMGSTVDALYGIVVDEITPSDLEDFLYNIAQALHLALEYEKGEEDGKARGNSRNAPGHANGVDADTGAAGKTQSGDRKKAWA